MSFVTSPETPERRLEGIRGLTLALRDSSDDSTWRVALAIEQLCLGTITVAQANAQLED